MRLNEEYQCCYSTTSHMRASNTEDFRILGATTGAGTIAEIGKLLVYVALAPPDKAELDAFTKEAALHRGRAGSSAGYLVLVSDTSIPPGEVRDAIAKMFDFLLADGAGIALVLEAQGFVASIQRSVAVGLSMMTKQRDRLRVFPNAGDAVLWLANLSGHASEGTRWAVAAKALQQHVSSRAAEAAAS